MIYLSTLDLQRLSRVFNSGCDLRTTQDRLINDWLCSALEERANGCTCRRLSDGEKDPDCQLGDHG